MSAACAVAQAKVNLFLHVLAREASGYHQLETLFQRLALGDEVRLRAGGRGRALDCRGADVGPVERNLAWRAALAYVAAAGWPDGFAIEVDKRIPVGGGLGGGSADAGAVLRLLNVLAPAPLPAGRLLDLAVALGADVPFLAAEDARALAWGRGERLLPLPPLPRRPVALLLPPVGVPTADAFAWLAADRAGAAPPPRRLSLERLGDWAGVASLAANDFEGPVAARVPEVAALAARRATVGRADVYLMSGSGSSWFLIPHDGGATADADGAGWRTVWTETAERVAPVERLD